MRHLLAVMVILMAVGVMTVNGQGDPSTPTSDTRSQPEVDFSGVWVLSQLKGQPETFLPNSPAGLPPPSPFTAPPNSLVVTQTADRITIRRNLVKGREETLYDRNSDTGHSIVSRVGPGADELSHWHHTSRASLSGPVLMVVTDSQHAMLSIGRTKEVYTLAGLSLTLVEVHDLTEGRMMRSVVYRRQ